jgi:predicted phage tail protein
MFEGRVLLREGSRYWWVLLLIGIAWLVVAWIVLRADITSLATVGILLGCLFIAAGINEVMFAGAVAGGWKFLHYAMGVIFLLGGLWAFIRPVNTFFALASVLGLILLFYGAFEIVRGVASRAENRFWWVGLVTGILLILLAFWVSSSDRAFNLANRAWLILFWVGFMALIRGFTQIMLAFSIRRAGRALDEEVAPTTAIP